MKSFISFLKKIWNWLNGNKLVLGLFLMAMINQVFFKQYFPESSTVWQVINWLAGLLSGTGVIHKIAKANTNPGPNA